MVRGAGQRCSVREVESHQRRHWTAERPADNAHAGLAGFLVPGRHHVTRSKPLDGHPADQRPGGKALAEQSHDRAHVLVILRELARDLLGPEVG